MKIIREKIKSIPSKILFIGIIIGIIAIFNLGFGLSSSIITKTTKLGFENVGELVTQTSHVTVIGDNKKDLTIYNSITIPFTESRQIFSYDYDVDASVDFNKITYSIDKINKEVNIKLPHSKVYKVTEEKDSLKIYLDEDGLFTRITLEDKNKIEKDLINQAKEDSVNNGLLDRANENAKKLISGLVKSNKKYKEYKINYKYLD